MAKQVEERSSVLNLNVWYHYAHAIGYGQKVSVVDLVNAEEGVVKINETLINSGNDILVKFSCHGIKTILNEEIINARREKVKPNDNLTLEVDTYSGTVAIKYTTPRSVPNPSAHQQYMEVNNDRYTYNEKIGYSEQGKNTLYGGRTDVGIAPQFEWINKYKPADDFGYIMETPPRMVLILFKELAYVENLQKGILKFRTSSFDLNGYVVQLFPEAILEITQLADKARMPLLERDVPLREVQEEKDEKPQLAKSEEVDLESLGLVSNVGEEVAVEVLGGHEDVLVHYE